MDQCTEPSEHVALATLLLDAAQQATRGSDSRSTEFAAGVCQRLKRSRATWERVAFLVANHVRLLDAPQLPTEVLKRLLRHKGVHELRALSRLHVAAEKRESAAADFCHEKLDTYIWGIIYRCYHPVWQERDSHQNTNLRKREHQRVDAAR